MLRIVQRPIVLFAVLVVFASGACAYGQAPIVDEPGFTPTLTFDVVSIRPSPPAGNNFHLSVNSPPHSSRFEVSNFPMKALLQIAYGSDLPVVGAPEWVSTTFYDLKARSDDAADARLAKLTDNEVRLEKRHAIQAMLADRLELKTHLETRNTAIYNMVPAKGGVKMQPVPRPAAPADGGPPPPLPPMDFAAHGSQHGLEFDVTDAPMRAVSSSLSSMLEEPVFDKTGLTGVYSYTLQFGREWSAHDPDSWPSIFTAVQEQLGLKLEAEHEPVPNLVVDHITKPTEN
jgi:uncharacterized protein (TIGR03435 family)